MSTAPYTANMGIGSSSMGTHYSGCVAPTSSYGGVPTQGGYVGGRGMQQGLNLMLYPSGQGQSGKCNMYMYMMYMCDMIKSLICTCM